MVDERILNVLNPYDSYNPWQKLPFDLFCERASELLPNFPGDVLDQWPYEDFQTFLFGSAQGIAYDELKFQKCVWDVERIKQIVDPDMFYESGIGWDIVDGTLYTTLAQYMSEYGTWPRPIIVYETQASKTDDRYNYRLPLHLLEGHRRLVYLRRMIDADMRVLPQHEVWVATQT